MPAHPALAPVVVRRPPQGERTWQGTENALAALREAGLDDATAAATYQGLLNYTLGHAALEAPYALMRFVPYGVYDLADDSGWVSVGVDHGLALGQVGEVVGGHLLGHADRLPLLAGLREASDQLAFLGVHADHRVAGVQVPAGPGC